jgi:hypothetical protein
MIVLQLLNYVLRSVNSVHTMSPDHHDQLLMLEAQALQACTQACFTTLAHFAPLRCVTHT